MNEKMEELLTFYALDALTDSERKQVEAYVASDPEARLRLDEMMRTASALPYASEPLDPPPALKRTLMDRVNADAKKRFAPPPPIQASSWSRFIESILPRLFPQAVTVLSLFIALAVGAWGLSLRNELNNLQAQTAQLQEEVAQQQEELAEQRAQLQEELAEQQALLGLIASPNAQTFDVAGTDHQPGSHGRLFADSETGSAVLVVAGLQQLEARETYEFWLIKGDTPVAAGLFDVNNEGKAILRVSHAVTPGSYDAIGVSVEPEGGSEQPTGAIVMLSEID